jgi:hypothetical protein
MLTNFLIFAVVVLSVLLLTCLGILIDILKTVTDIKDELTTDTKWWNQTTYRSKYNKYPTITTYKSPTINTTIVPKTTYYDPNSNSIN